MKAAVLFKDLSRNLLRKTKNFILYVLKLPVFCNKGRGFVIEDIVICRDDQVRFIGLGRTHIIYYDNGTQQGYFRECRLHETRKKYLQRYIREYFTYIVHDEHGRDFEQLLMKKLDSFINICRFYHMGRALGRKWPEIKIPYARFAKFNDLSALGIHGQVPEWFSKLLPGFVDYMVMPVFEYNMNSNLKPYQYQMYSSSKMKAAKIVADMIGVPEVITQTKYICLRTGDTIRIGVSTRGIKGIEPDSMAGRELKVMPSFQRESLMLNMLDVICYEKDHAPRNYIAKLDDTGKNITGLSAFDNDSDYTFAPSPSVYISFNFCKLGTSFVGYDGYINRPFLDRQSTSSFLKVTYSQIINTLTGYLSWLEIMMLCYRVYKLKRAIRKSIHDGVTRLIDADEFSHDTMLEETGGGGRYGETYLKHFIDKYHIKI